jgi:hypothetical protein
MTFNTPDDEKAMVANTVAPKGTLVPLNVIQRTTENGTTYKQNVITIGV